MTDAVGPDWSGRLQQLKDDCTRQGLDALVISAPVNITYLTGFRGTAGLLLVGPERARLLVDGRYEAMAREGIAAGRVTDVDVTRVTGRYDVALAEVAPSVGARIVGFEAGDVTVATLSAWQRRAPDVTWRATERVVERLRLVKDAFEQAVFRRAARLIDAIVGQLASMVARGRSERDVARQLDAAILAAGFADVAFPTIVASGPHSAHPHATPGDRQLVDGDLVVLDFGGVLDGYCVDITRMAAVGRVSDRALAMFDAVAAAQQAAIAKVREGITCPEVDAGARDVLQARGFGEAFVHGTGHGLGLQVHEAPRVGRDDGEPVERLSAGMVCTIEPGAYVEGLGGVRLEDDVLVTTTGCEVLTVASRELLVV